ncbi:hypothetical protein [Pseudarthrobacter sp. H2]|uniref:hypothetical protein n=1 Tax=Pseudarthrobacter sp. H2 TaxID=3418415 RepID=UPI003CF031B9
MKGGFDATTSNGGSDFISNQDEVRGQTMLPVVPAVDHRPEVTHFETFVSCSWD